MEEHSCACGPGGVNHKRYLFDRRMRDGNAEGAGGNCVIEACAWRSMGEAAHIAYHWEPIVVESVRFMGACGE